MGIVFFAVFTHSVRGSHALSQISTGPATVMYALAGSQVQLRGLTSSSGVCMLCRKHTSSSEGYILWCDPLRSISNVSRLETYRVIEQLRASSFRYARGALKLQLPQSRKLLQLRLRFKTYRPVRSTYRFKFLICLAEESPFLSYMYVLGGTVNFMRAFIMIVMIYLTSFDQQ